MINKLIWKNSMAKSAQLLLIIMLLGSFLLLRIQAQEIEYTPIKVIEITQTDTILQIEWSPDGTKLALLSWDNISILETQNWIEINQINNPHVYSIAWHPDSELIAGVQGGTSEHLIIWEVMLGDVVYEYKRAIPPNINTLASPSQTISWHPEGNIIATDATLAFDEI